METISLHSHLPPPKANSGRPANRRTPPLRRARPPTKLRRKKLPAIERKDIAFPESLPLHSKNPSAVYADIQRFARLNKLQKAFAILDYLDKQGIPVNATTFSALIAACARIKSLAHGKQVHAFVRANGLEANEFLRTKLVHMYSCCGSVDDARQMFDEIPGNSVYPWNAFLRGSVVAGGRRHREAASAYRQMRAMGLDLNVYTFSSILKSFAGTPAFSQGLKVHALLVKNGFIGSQILKTCLVDMYSKCGKINLARRIFDEIPERDVVLWGAMIAGLTHNRRQQEAFDNFREMTRLGTCPNSAILTTILPAIGDVSAPMLGREVHAYVVKTKSYVRQIFIQSALIDMYCKCGDLEIGRRVFFQSDERNAICWTTMISGYASNGRPDQALRSLSWMQQEGTKPDVVTVATVVPLCRELRALNCGKEIHAYAVKNHFFPNVSIASSLMMMYSKCGVLHYSSRLFEATEEKRNLIVWTSMIDSYLENNRPIDALSVFRSMAESKHRPDSVAIGRVLVICGDLKSLRLGKEVHCHALKKNFESIHFVSARIVRMYGSCNAIDHARSAFDAIQSKGSRAWTAIIEAHQYNNLYRDAIALFDRMSDRGFSPNHHTFRVLLSVCGEAGYVDEARRIFDLMTRRFKIKASEEHYSLIIELLTRMGRGEDAQRFLQLRSSFLSRLN